MKDHIAAYFQLHRFPASSIGTEVRAGLSTFLTMSYILLVNPQILGSIGLNTSDVVLATALSSAFGTFVTAVLGNLPFGLAPGMGLSAYLAFGLVQGSRAMTSEKALTCCFLAGVIMALSALSGLSTLIMKCIPKSVKLATVTGMGLLIALIGLKQVSLVVANESTLVALGDLSDYNVWLCLAGVLLIGTLLSHNVKGSILIGIVVISLISWAIEGNWPREIVSLPRPKYSFGETIDLRDISMDMLPGILGFLFVGVFDVSGILFGMARLAGLEDENHHVPGDIWGYMGASIGTIIAAMMGSSPIIVHVESAAGIKEGGRTGLTSLTIAVLFIVSIFFAPLFENVPPVATSPVLIIVGAMMMGECVNVEWHSIDQAIPAFLTLIMMPFTFSIADGVAFGIGAATLLGITTGKWVRTVRGCLSKRPQVTMDLEVGERELLLPQKQPSLFEQLTADNPETVERSPRLLLSRTEIEHTMERSHSLPYGTTP
ncbi:hypothetical protein ATCC90586_010869 [Pythium insidiosum]|nr:hypothetical protein ATCC90586_010869 [Pythium insidiosum]